MRFFDWYSVNLRDVLQDPHVKAIQRWTSRGIYNNLMDDSYVEKFYQWNLEWLELMRSLSEEDAITLISNTAWNKLSPIAYPSRDDPIGIEDYEEWKRISIDAFDDPYIIEHYVYMHRCYILALFIYFVVSTLFPDKKFLICDSNRHAFVIEEGVEDVIYDIFWWYLDLGLPDKPWITYDNPMTYSHKRLVIDDLTTAEDEMRLLSLNVIYNSFLER